jgi:chaperonin GroES
MAARRLVPLLDRVLVQRLEPPTKSLGGVLLPESSQSKLNEGVVVAVGPGRRDKDGALLPMGVKANDKVLLPQYGGNEVSMNDEDFVLFRDEDILGVLADK